MTVSNGRKVTDYIPKLEVDAVFMDLQMPVMDSVSAFKRIRAISGKCAATPVIAVTANILSESQQEMEEMT